MTRLLLALLAFYRRWLSPIVHSLGTGGFRYLPTCSEYAIVAISTHGPHGPGDLEGAALPSFYPRRARSRSTPSAARNRACKTFSPRTVTIGRAVALRAAPLN